MEKIIGYTKGPLQSTCAIPERQFCAQVFDAKGKAVATMDHMSDEGTANAKLYSLAPTLYEQHLKVLVALRKIKNELEVDGDIECAIDILTETIKDCEL